MEGIISSESVEVRQKSHERSETIRFSGLVLDLDACRLTRETGEAIELTRGEFKLLRCFACQSGRVLSRDALLDAVANRRIEPFDRSIDVLVGRLRRKIEPDPKRPALIVTVPGEGYRFDAAVEETPDRRNVTLADAAGAVLAKSETRDGGGRETTFPGTLLHLFARPASLPALAVACLSVFLVAFWARPPAPADVREPVIAVEPFAELGNSTEQSNFGVGIAEDVRTILATFPGVRVKEGIGSGSAHPLVADFVLEGGVLEGPERVRVTVQLTNTRTGEHVWAQRFDEDSDDIIAVQETIANKIYKSVAGLEGWIRKEEERSAWRKVPAKLDEYDYYLRGHTYFFRGTCDDTMLARRVWQDGLRQFPNSALLRIKIAFSYTNGVENYCSSDPSGDIERAWALGREASTNANNSALTTWLAHWLMTVLYQWHDKDFERSIGEAKSAVRLVPYDARSRAEMAFYLANAGKLDQAAEWSAWATHGPSAKYGYQNLAWAYYLMGRYQDALTALNQSDPKLPGYRQQLATTYVRLGRLAEAQSVIRDWMQTNPSDSVSFEATWPMKDEYRAAYIADLRLAGMPD